MTTAPPAERQVARFRAHGRALLLPTLVLVLVCGGLAFGLSRVTQSWLVLGIAGAGLAVIVVGGLAPVLRWLSRSYTITTRRTIARRGVLVRVHQEVPHVRAVDVTVRRSAAQAMFGSGDVLIGTGAGHPLVLRDVARPRLVADAVHELLERTGQDVSIG